MALLAPAVMPGAAAPAVEEFAARPVDETVFVADHELVAEVLGEPGGVDGAVVGPELDVLGGRVEERGKGCDEPSVED